MALRTTVGTDGRSASIELPERFTFDTHAEFRAAYRSQPAAVQTFVLDFRRTAYLDSAALGMLLQLLEHAGGDARRVRLVNRQAHIDELLRLADFEQQLTFE